MIFIQSYFRRSHLRFTDGTRDRSEGNKTGPESAIYWTFGNFLKPLATINLPKSPTFLGNFCKCVKIYHFSSEINFGQLFIVNWRFFLVTLNMDQIKSLFTMQWQFFSHCRLPALLGCDDDQWQELFSCKKPFFTLSTEHLLDNQIYKLVFIP